MADNVEITAGSGTTIATDDISSVHYQRMKLVDGALGGTGAIGGDAANGLDVDVTRLLAGEMRTVVTVAPTLDTNAYASGDLLFDATEIANAVRAVGGLAMLDSVTLIDKDDQGVAFFLVFANAATDFGTLNSAPDPDDTEAATVIGYVEVPAANYLDLGGAKVATVRNVGLLLKAGAATTSLWVAGINGTSTPTYTAAGMALQLGFTRI